MVYGNFHVSLIDNFSLPYYYCAPSDKCWIGHNLVYGKLSWPVFFIYLGYTFKSSKRTIIVLYEDGGISKVMIVNAGDTQNPLRNVKYVIHLNESYIHNIRVCKIMQQNKGNGKMKA